MAKTCTLHVRMDPTLKINAEKVLEEIGMSSSDAINLFYNQICLKSGIPFEITKDKKKKISQKYEKINKKSLSGILSKYANPALIDKEKNAWYEEAHE